MSHQGFTSTFKEFKESFYSRVGDGTLFSVADVNLLKVALDGLKVKYSSRGKIRHFFDEPAVTFYGHFIARALKDLVSKKKAPRESSGKVLLGFSSRTLEENGKYYPVYFQRLFNVYGREQFYFVSEERGKINPDLVLTDLTPGFSFLRLKNRQFYKQLRNWCIKLDERWTEEEKTNIRISVYLFYVEYLKWNTFLDGTNFKSALITQSYHREGFILACRQHQLKVNELQHGLIAKEDIFYVMPAQIREIIHKAMFPDSIIVYGNYWKEILSTGSEFNNEAIKVGGYFHYEARQAKSAESVVKGRKRKILVTTQYSAHDYFSEFAKKLAPKLNDEWMIVVKPHPSEKAELYKPLCKFSNIKVDTGNLDALIQCSEFIVTIFSTTIFDALRYGKCSFSLNFPLFSDYTRSLSEAGLAISLNPDENPVGRLNEAKRKLYPKEHLYSDFNKPLFDSIIL